MQSYWLIQVALFVNHVFHSDTISATECYDPQYQKPSEGQ